MRRGDLVTVAAAGDYGKPRPDVIVQTDAFPENHASVPRISASLLNLTRPIRESAVFWFD
jgi:mRNA-degrading endonuclease toxin of MazEF toxin-antitoxin module